MLTIGNEELLSLKKASKFAICPNCGEKHKIEYGTNSKTGKTSTMLGFVSCGQKDYLVTIDGKILKIQPNNNE